MARIYQYTQELLEVIKHLQAEGLSQKEIFLMQEVFQKLSQVTS